MTYGLASEYQIYQSQGGTETLTQYEVRLNKLRTQIGEFINIDPKNHLSNIGKTICSYVQRDLPTAVTFSQVSKGCHERAEQHWFVYHTREIILRYIKQGVDYKTFLKEGGWKDYVILGVKIAGVALTVTSAVKANQHRKLIPLDAPKKTQTYTDEYGHEYEVTYIDHPEARKAEGYTFAAVTVGTATALTVIGHGIYALLKDVDLSVFFSQVEKDVIAPEKCNALLKILKKMVSPAYDKWKWTRLKERLTANPANWSNHPDLKNEKCPLSNDFRLFPVKDGCGHTLDYRSVRAHQLDPTKNASKCPLNTRNPNNQGLAHLKFDKARFDRIMRIINPPQQTRNEENSVSTVESNIDSSAISSVSTSASNQSSVSSVTSTENT